MKKKVIVVLIVAIIVCLSIIGLLIYKLNSSNKANGSTNSNYYSEKNDEDDLNDEPTQKAENDLSNESSEESVNKNIQDEKIINNKPEDSTKNKTTTSSSNITSGKSSSTKAKYSCPNGYTLDGTICIERKKAKVIYKCVYGEVVGDSCIINTSVPANVTYSCSSGNLSGDTCYTSKRVSTFNESDYSSKPESIKMQMYNTFVNNCLGYNGSIEEENGIKHCVQIYQTPASASYDCNGKTGTLAGDMCISAKVEKAYAEYSCDQGYGLDIPYCIKTTPATKIK